MELLGSYNKLKNKNACLSSLETLHNFILKILDSAELSDNSTSKLFVFLEEKAMEYQRSCEVLRDETKRLRAEKASILLSKIFLKDAMHDALSRVEDSNRQLSDESQRLQKQLDVIRDVLRDNDVDRAKSRLEKLEDICFNRLLTPKKSGRTEHSAGSLLDSENTSTAGSEYSDHRPSGDRRNSIMKPGILRRSERLSSSGKRPSFSFMTMKAGSKCDAINTSITSLFRKRQSSNASSYQDVAFKKSAIENSPSGFVVPNVPEDTMSINSNTTFNSCAEDNVSNTGLVDTNTFRTPLRPVSNNRLTRPHQFESVSFLRLQPCSYCGKRIALRKPVLRCRVCRLGVHPSCQAQLKQRCVPPTDLPASPRTPDCRTPGVSVRDLERSQRKRNPVGRSSTTGSYARNTLTLRGSPAPIPISGTSTIARRRLPPWHSYALADLCPPNEFPQIPAAVIHCINEVAARGLLQVGIYRVSGSQKRVFELLEKFLYGRTTPSLALVDDINVVCSCLKAFLRMLSEPLVTYSLRADFLEAAHLAENGDTEAAKYRVATLLDTMPPHYRDTLAFVILHLKAVSRSPTCKMNDDNLSKVFGLTLIGNSCPDLPVAQAATEVSVQQMAVRLLLLVPDAVYSTIIA